jgi:hypothetical protein
MFGGNSNWRGPIWMPLNHLLIEALERYDHFYGEALRVPCPTRTGPRMRLGEVANELRRRLVRLFEADGEGRRPADGDPPSFPDRMSAANPLCFPEYFHGDTGRGLGASQQTGWTALIAECIHDPCR